MERMYAYLVTDVTGTQVGKTKPGEHLLEREYKGNGSYTWTIYDFGKRGMPLAATITGRYVGIVHGDGGRLTEESRELLAQPSTRG
jgi:hypothetical protein